MVKQQPVSNGSASHHTTLNGNGPSSLPSSDRKPSSKIHIIIAICAIALVVPSKNAISLRDFRHRVYNAGQAFYKLATLPIEDWDAYYKSLEVIAKPQIENANDERLIGAWYKVVNLFCDLGNLEKMYLPPVIDPEMGLTANQILTENKMALGAASWSWNSSYINRVGDLLPKQYKNRYVMDFLNESKILDVGEPVPDGMVVRPMEILDLGCGKGRVAHEMMVYTGGNVVGVNIDVTQIRNAMKFALEKNLWPERLNFHHGSFNDPLPFPDESFDFVYEIGAFTYMIDKLAVFREIYRVLRPGGTFCYQDWTNTGYDANDPEQFRKIMFVKKISGLIELHQPEELASVARQAGFEVIFNDDGGYEAKVSSQLVANMNSSFWYLDKLMQFIISAGILPKRFVKAWNTIRPTNAGDAVTLKETIDLGLLNMGHVFVIRKPLE